MAHSIRVLPANKERTAWIGSVETKGYGMGRSLFKTEPTADRTKAYAAAVEWRTANSAKNAAARADKSKAHMTCQCCGRKHQANTGKTAHHGYQRPGNGWQTASCSGARELPFEVSRDRLGWLINSLTDQVTRKIGHRDEIELETIPVKVNFEDRSKAKEYNHLTERTNFPTVNVNVTRETFEAVKASNDPHFSRHGRNNSFADVKAATLSTLNREISQINDYITECKTRYNGWKQTHSGFDRASKTWIAL